MLKYSAPTRAEILNRLRDELSEETFQHSLRTAAIARTLAEQHSVDADSAELAGLVHDVGDRYTDAELLQLADELGIPPTLSDARVPRLLHAPVAAELLRRDWGIDDEEVLDAVRDHVVGSVRMSQLSKILFVADKIEPGQDQFCGGFEAIEATAMTDLDGAVLRIFAWRMADLLSRDRPIHDRLVAARNRLIEHRELLDHSSLYQALG